MNFLPNNLGSGGGRGRKGELNIFLFSVSFTLGLRSNVFLLSNGASFIIQSGYCYVNDVTSRLVSSLSKRDVHTL